MPPRHDGEAAVFALLNRGKKSLVLDLKNESDRSRLRPLLEKADVLVEQFRPGVMERLDLGYEAVREDQSAHRLLLDLRLRPARSARRRGRPRHQLPEPHRPARAAAGADRPAGRAARARRRHRRRHHAGGDQHPARPAPARRDRRGRLSRHRDDRRDVHLRLVRLCDRARDREISRRRANCAWSAARRATSSIRRATASSSPAARWSRNSGSRSATRIGLPAPLMNDLADPEATKAADRRRSSRARPPSTGGRNSPPPIAASPSWRRWKRRCTIRISSSAGCSRIRSRALRARPCRRCRCRSPRPCARRRARSRRRSSARTMICSNVSARPRESGDPGPRTGFPLARE